MPVFILTIVYNFMSFGRSIEVPTLLDVQKFWVKDTDRQTEKLITVTLRFIYVGEG